MTPPLSPEQAADLYRHLLRDVLDATAQFASELGLDPVLAVHPAGACAELAAACPAGFRVVPQRGADLSERMTWAVREAAAGGADRILLRGSDSPLLGVETVRTALRALERVDLVLLPDLDGGYGLVGLRAPVPGLFDHPMSTATVQGDTLARAARVGLSTRVLAPDFDLDTAEDLARLARARAGGRAGLCPHTLAYLDAQGLWP
jgi:hypothetical protein